MVKAEKHPAILNMNAGELVKTVLKDRIKNCTFQINESNFECNSPDKIPIDGVYLFEQDGNISKKNHNKIIFDLV